jgi:hypothetical protein
VSNERAGLYSKALPASVGASGFFQRPSDTPLELPRIEEKTIMFDLEPESNSFSTGSGPIRDL